jgi:chromosome partitioning protein
MCFYIIVARRAKVTFARISIPVIGCMNQKGGVGKSTISALLAEWFALMRKKRVLLIDLDMQCNTSDKWVGMEPVENVLGGQLPPRNPNFEPSSECNERSSIADIFWGKSVLPYETWLDSEVGQGGYVDVLCGHPELLEKVNISFAKTDKQLEETVHNQLRGFLSSEDFQSYYDLVIIDTGPSRTPTFRAALRAASHIIIPFSPEENDLQGIVAMLQVVRQENFYRPSSQDSRLKVLGLLPNKVRKATKLHRDNLDLIQTAHSDILFPEECWLPLSTKYPERDSKGSRPKSVFELSAGDAAVMTAISMAKHVEKNLFQDLLSEDNKQLGVAI